jgi:hypothetical protein
VTASRRSYGRTSSRDPLAADLSLNASPYLPAGFLCVAVIGIPLRVVLAESRRSGLLIETWQAMSGARSCTVNDLWASVPGASIGVAIGGL